MNTLSSRGACLTLALAVMTVAGSAHAARHDYTRHMKDKVSRLGTGHGRAAPLCAIAIESKSVKGGPTGRVTTESRRVEVLDISQVEADVVESRGRHYLYLSTKTPERVLNVYEKRYTAFCQKDRRSGDIECRRPKYDYNRRVGRTRVPLRKLASSRLSKRKYKRAVRAKIKQLLKTLKAAQRSCGTHEMRLRTLGGLVSVFRRHGRAYDSLKYVKGRSSSRASRKRRSRTSKPLRARDIAVGCKVKFTRKAANGTSSTGIIHVKDAEAEAKPGALVFQCRRGKKGCIEYSTGRLKGKREYLSVGAIKETEGKSVAEAFKKLSGLCRQ